MGPSAALSAVWVHPFRPRLCPHVVAPPIQSQGWLAAYYAGLYVLYDTVATFVYMPYFALTPELTLDYDERTALTPIAWPSPSWAG